MINIVSLINGSKNTHSQRSLRKDRKNERTTDQQILLEYYVNTEKKVLPRASLSHYRNKTSSFNRCSSYPVTWYELSLPLQNCLIALEKEQDTLEYSFYRFRQHALHGKYNQHTRTVMRSKTFESHVVHLISHVPYAGELTELFSTIHAKPASAEVITHQLLTNGGSSFLIGWCWCLLFKKQIRNKNILSRHSCKSHCHTKTERDAGH